MSPGQGVEEHAGHFGMDGGWGVGESGCRPVRAWEGVGEYVDTLRFGWGFRVGESECRPVRA